MPVKRISAKPRHNHPELVQALVEELRNPRKIAEEGIPDIREEEQAFGGRIHVEVIWDLWEGVGQDERGPIILDAYKEARGVEEMLKIAQARGLTIEENLRLRARAAS